MTYIGASFNIFKKLSDWLAAYEVRMLQSRYPNLSFAGLQEIDWHIENADINGWNFYQPERFDPGKDPIIWNPYYWPTLVASGHNVIIPRREFDNGSVLVERNAVWVVLENANDRVAVVNIHLHSDVEQPPGMPNGTIQQKDHYMSLRKTIEISNALVTLYECPVVIVGDFNVDYGSDKSKGNTEFPYYNLTKSGYSAVWDLGEQSTRTADPEDGRTIDHAWGKGVVFTRVRTPNQWGPYDPINSDHLPVIFDFDLNF